MKKVLLAAVLGSMLLSMGCRDSKPNVDKGQIDNLARKVLLAMSSDKPQEIYEECFSENYKEKLSEAEWVEMAKGYTQRLGKMTDMVRINLNLIEINDCIEATVKYDVTWSKAQGWLEMSISKADNQPWKAVKVFVRSDAINENNEAPKLKLPDKKEEIKPKVELPTGNDTPELKPLAE